MCDETTRAIRSAPKLLVCLAAGAVLVAGCSESLDASGVLRACEADEDCNEGRRCLPHPDHATKVCRDPDAAVADGAVDGAGPADVTDAPGDAPSPEDADAMADLEVSGDADATGDLEVSADAAADADGVGDGAMDGDASPEPPDGDGGVDAPGDAPEGDADVGDAGDADAAGDAPDGGGVDFDCGPEETGAPGCACSEASDCDSGWCVPAAAGATACTATCSGGADCPSGYACRDVSSEAGGEASVCLYEAARYCRPCGADDACNPEVLATSEGTPHRCLERPEQNGSFCATACAGDADCPEGASCEAIEVDGDPISLCRPAGEEGCEAPCTEAAVEAGASTPCTVDNDHGSCSGMRTCTDDGLGDCDAPAPAPDTSCNGVDDDCDGDTDEDYASEPTTCGKGVCRTEGQLECDGGEEVPSCEPGEPAGDDTSCNGDDDDCDGTTDEHYQVSTTTCGKGACASQGEEICDGGQTEDTCEPGEPSPEVCDGVDNDCNGNTDDGLTDPVEAGCREAGVCGGEAAFDQVTAACEAGVWYCDYGDVPDFESADDGSKPEEGDGTCLPEMDEDCHCPQLASGECFDPVEQSCDGEDNDCDGLTDDEFDVGQKCDADGDGNACFEDVVTCIDENEPSGAECADVEGSDEVCDGEDNDCDDWQDEPFRPASSFEEDAPNDAGTASPYDGGPYDADAGKLKGESCGTGACSGGTVVCDADDPTALTCSSLDEGSDETCNGADDDCDGHTDEGLRTDEGLPVGETGCLTDAGVCGDDGDAIEAACIDGTWRCDYGAVQSIDIDQGTTCEPGDAGCHCPDLDEPCHPLAERSCDDADNDCDGATDEELDTEADFPVEQTGCITDVGVCAADAESITAECLAGVWYCGYNEVDDKDIQGGQCAPDEAGCSCIEVAPGDWQCNPLDESTCDDLDNDCDAGTDEGLPDGDGDGVCDVLDNCPDIANADQEDTDDDDWGDACDCDVDDPDVYPGAPELCDGRVNDCGSALPADEQDGDDDAYVPCELDVAVEDWMGEDPIEGGGDCRDDRPLVHPLPEEGAGCYLDADEDGWGHETPEIQGVDEGTDCDDDAAFTHPHAAEEEDDPSLCRKDFDDDGYGDESPDTSGVEEGEDCNDDHDAVHPGQESYFAEPYGDDSYDYDCSGQPEPRWGEAVCVENAGGSCVLDEAGYTLDDPPSCGDEGPWVEPEDEPCTEGADGCGVIDLADPKAQQCR